jgi:hypothetical protein
MMGRLINWVCGKKIYDFYLAGPMRSYPNGNKELFLKAAKWLRQQGFTVWNPAEQNDGNKNFHSCIKKDLDAIIRQCKSIALLPGWRDSLGANTEALTAYVCGKPAQYITFTRDGWFYLSYADIKSGMVLPFNPSKEEFRQQKEMVVPESEIFSSTQ